MSELSYNPYDFLEAQRTMENLDKDINEIINKVELRKQEEFQNKLELYENAFLEIYTALDLTMKTISYREPHKADEELFELRIILRKLVGDDKIDAIIFGQGTI